MVVIPFTQAEWTTMLMLREDNRLMAEKDRSKYAKCIEKNNTCLKCFYNKEIAA